MAVCFGNILFFHDCVEISLLLLLEKHNKIKRRELSTRLAYPSKGLSHCLVWDKQRSITHVREYVFVMPYLHRLRHDDTYTICGHFPLPYLPDKKFARFRKEDSDVAASSVNNKISLSTYERKHNDGANIHLLFLQVKI